MIYDRIEDVPSGTIEAILSGAIVLGRTMRTWRKDCALHSVSAQWMSADGPITVRCDYEDRITIQAGDASIDISELIDARQ